MPTTVPAKVRHKEFCLPGEGRAEPRIESYPYYADDPKSGLSRVTFVITRCMECGAEHNQPKEN